MKSRSSNGLGEVLFIDFLEDGLIQGFRFNHKKWKDENNDEFLIHFGKRRGLNEGRLGGLDVNFKFTWGRSED